MRIIFLGTCSGTEPMPGRKHTSVALDTGEGLYFFDVGEGCSYTAHNMGLDILKTRKIIISHPHMDHVGGLGNLLWVIRKLRYTQKRPISHEIDVFTSNMSTYDGAMMTLSATEGNFEVDFEISPRRVRDGLLFDDGGIKVTAMHNSHLKWSEDNGWQSFSYLIEARGRRIVYSGDVKDISELDSWLPCDFLLMETGHHDPGEVAKHAAEKKVDNLIYMHHGRTIMNDPDGWELKVKALFGEKAVITHDGMVLEL
ncbi:MAG: MBL fold metallo-hydrolase [Christensenellales bacterium]|jgi:ribonuclease BN (tRNA processing enzyme)